MTIKCKKRFQRIVLTLKWLNICIYIFVYNNIFVVRFLLTLYQAKMEGSILEEDSTGNFYKYLYFEFPYHLFNIVAFIVLMQW